MSSGAQCARPERQGRTDFQAHEIWWVRCLLEQLHYGLVAILRRDAQWGSVIVACLIDIGARSDQRRHHGLAALTRREEQRGPASAAKVVRLVDFGARTE